jgi:HEAT repeat protein
MDLSASDGGQSEPGLSRALAPKIIRPLLGIVLLALLGGAFYWVLAPVLRREPEKSPEPAAALAFHGLRSGNPSERQSALRQVVQFGMGDINRSIPLVIESLADSDAAVRAQAAQTLAILGSYAVLESPSDMSSQSGGPGLVSATTSALIVTLAKDEQSFVRAAAADALRNISVTTPRAAAMSTRGSEKAGGGPARATTPSTSPVDLNAIEAALTAALHDRNDDVRSAAATALGGAGPRASAEPPQPLVKALSDESAATRAAAAKALANFQSGLGPVIPALIRLSASDTHAVHEACTEALGKIKRSAYSAAAVPALVDGLKDRDREVRLHVLSLLAPLGPEAADAVPALIAVLNEPLDSDRTTGRAVGRSLMSVSTGPAHEAAKALGKIAPGTRYAGKAVNALAEVVHAGPARRRASAADALGEFGPLAAAAVPALIQMLAESDAGKSDVPNRDGEAAAQAMSRIAAGSQSSEAVVAALGESLRSKTSTSRPAVLRALKHLEAQAAAPIGSPSRKATP